MTTLGPGRTSAAEVDDPWAGIEDGPINVGEGDQPTSLRWRWQLAFRASRLGPAVTAVGFAFASYASSDGGSIFPTQERVATETGISERTISRALATLTDRGWLVLVARAEPGKGRSTVYRLALPNTGHRVLRLPVTESADTGHTDVHYPTQSPPLTRHRVRPQRHAQSHLQHHLQDQTTESDPWAAGIEDDGEDEPCEPPLEEASWSTPASASESEPTTGMAGRAAARKANRQGDEPEAYQSQYAGQ